VGEVVGYPEITRLLQLTSEWPLIAKVTRPTTFPLCRTNRPNGTIKSQFEPTPQNLARRLGWSEMIKSSQPLRLEFDRHENSNVFAVLFFCLHAFRRCTLSRPCPRVFCRWKTAFVLRTGR
jgi:hypothetical protein